MNAETPARLFAIILMHTDASGHFRLASIHSRLLHKAPSSFVYGLLVAVVHIDAFIFPIFPFVAVPFFKYMAFSGEENAPESTGGELCNGSSSSEIHSSNNNNNDNQTSDKANTSVTVTAAEAQQQQQSQEMSSDCFLMNNLGLKKEQALCNGSTLDLKCNISMDVAAAADDDDDSPSQVDNASSNVVQQQQQQQLAQLNKVKTADAQCNGLVANVQLPAKRSARTAAKNRSLLDSLLTIKKIKVEEAAASVIAKQQNNNSISKTAAAAANSNKVDPQAESVVNNNSGGGLFESPLLPNGNAETSVPMNPRSGGAGTGGGGGGGKLHGNVYQAEKSFICEICGKAFRFRSNLAEHRSVHTSLKPYVCRFCGKSSRLKGNLTKHILKHHKREQNEFIGKDDIIIKKGKKSVKDPAAVDFLEKSMIILTSEQAALTTAAGQQQQQQQQSTQVATACQSNSAGGGVPAATTVMDECLKAEKYFAPIQEARRSSPMLFNSASLFSNDLVNDHDHHQGHPVSGTGGPGGAAAAAATAAAAAAAIGVGGIGAVIEAAKELLPTARNRRIIMPGTEPTAKKTPTPRQSLFGSAACLDAVGSTLASYGNAFPYSMLFEQRDSSSSSSSPSPATTTLEESLANMGVAIANRQRMMATPAAVPKTFPVSAVNSTRCQICQKHFRKSANLALHLMVKHHFPPPKETMLETVSPPSSSSGTGVVKLNDLLLFAASDHQRDQEVNKRQSPLSVAACGAQRTESPRLFKDAYSNTPSSTTASGHPSSSSAATLASEKLRETVAAATAAAGGSASALSGDLKEVKTALAQIKQATGDSAKVGALFKNLETRIAHLERQMETSANTLFAVFHMQSEMHNAFNAFKWDMVEQLKNLPRADLARQSRGRCTPKTTTATTTTTANNNNNLSSS
ncbi:Zinc finger protein [Trichinella spiralis]|uniref:Zinc finger protein n=1 Tax=Trichinella spiralis TaxID=6334 RepID=A0A0V1APJ5_TRISP|nr:Zinc finger protein [Trichinella spiralis]